MKIAINTCFGGFSLSFEAMDYMASRGHSIANNAIEEEARENPDGFRSASYYSFTSPDLALRSDPLLIDALEVLGSSDCSGRYSVLKVVEVPDGVPVYISDYDGVETIEENHRSWS